MLLDSELALLTWEQQRRRWTSWVLVGALGALLGLLVRQWAGGWPTGEGWRVSYVALTLAGFAVLSLIGFLRARSFRSDRLTTAHLASQTLSRLKFASDVVLATFLLVLLFGSESFSPWTRLVAGTVQGVGWLLSTVSLGFWFTRLPRAPLPRKADTRPTSKATRTHLVVLALFVLSAILAGRDLLDLAPAALEFGLGGLLATVGFWIRTRLDQAHGRSIIDQLLALRRELDSGGMSVEEAAQRLGLDDPGMQGADAPQVSLEVFIIDAARITRRCKESIARIDDSGLLPPHGQPQVPEPRQVAAARTLLEACQPRLAEVREALKPLEGQFRRIESRFRPALHLPGPAAAAMREMLARLTQSHQAAKASTQELESRVTRLELLVGASSKPGQAM